MVFSSTVFLFQFLPICLAIYTGAFWIGRSERYANLALIALSLAFYFIGSGALVILLILSIVVNFWIGRALPTSSANRRILLLVAGLTYNLAALFSFKYANFAFSSTVGLANLLGWHVIFPFISVALPVGISFYTFMSISYLVDVYKTGNATKSLVQYATYLSMFPHLVAGPIVRFSELREEITKRTLSATLFNDGIYRFSIGIVRKTVIADSLAAQSDRIFALPSTQLTPEVAWLGAICYSFQIFYDFSGYTDMAIGLAQMLGFHFPENFDQPYAAGSITHFWRRWHMTLTRWFRDYLYIPLGGNRNGAIRTYTNLVLVFFLCGLWHGAAWTFVAWGLYHGVLLVVERVLALRYGWRPSGVAGVALTFVLVTIGWVFFRSASIGDAFLFLSAMFASSATSVATVAHLGDYLTPSTACYLIVAAVFAFAPSALAPRITLNERFANAKGAIALLVLVLGVAYLSESTFKPFIYFRF